jgi:hypothetical protein
MKTYNLLLPILTIITLVSSCEQSQTTLSKTPEDFAKIVLLSLQTKNVDLYESTVPSYEELIKFQKANWGSYDYSQEDHKNKKANRLKWFFDTLKSAEEKNLNLSQSNYCGFMGKIDTLDNLIIIEDGYICFEIENQKYYIVADKAFQIDGEWKSIENLLGIVSQID